MVGTRVRNIANACMNHKSAKSERDSKSHRAYMKKRHEGFDHLAVTQQRRNYPPVRALRLDRGFRFTQRRIGLENAKTSRART